MRKLIATTAVVACAGAGTVLTPSIANAALSADQLIICYGGPSSSVKVTVENLTYDSLGPVPFTLTPGASGCQTIVNGTDPKSTPLSSTYRVAAQPIRTNASDTVTVVTTSGTNTTQSADEATVRVSSLEGVQVTFVL